MSITVRPENTSDWRTPKPGGSKPQGQIRVPGGLIGSAGVQPSSTVAGDHPRYLTDDEIMNGTPDESGAPPQGVIYATPDAILKAIVRHGFKSTSEMCGDPICFYCHGDMPTHDENCLYMQIKEYLEETGQL